MDIETEIRRASPEDREDVVGFASETQHRWNYIPDVYDDWLEEGDLLVAVARDGSDETVVGVIHLAGVSDDEAWIEGLRVDPDYTREEIATSLVDAAEETARENGAEVLRCMVFDSNDVGQEVFEGLGFEESASVRHARAFGFPYSTSLERDEDEEFVGTVEDTDAYEETGGLYVEDWRMGSLDGAEVGSDSSPALYLRDEDGETVGACLPTGLRLNKTDEQDREELVMGFVWSKKRYITEMGLQMRTEARVEDADDVVVFFPDDSDYVNSLESAGYDVSETVYVYEKRL